MTWLSVLLIGLAASARIHAYLSNRSLWLDEAMLAASVATRTFGGLTHPLEYNQLAPWGFLFLSKASVLTFGINEHAMRLIPFLAGLAALPLMYRVAHLCLGRRGGALLATTLFALSPVALYQSTEFKQYSTDGLWTLLILSVAIPVLRAGATPRRLLVLTAVGILALWSSFPSAFTLAAVCAILTVQAFRSSTPRDAVAGIGVAAVFGLNFFLSYRMATRQSSTQTFMRDFWQDAFLPLPPTSSWDIIRSLDVLNGLFATVTAPEPFLNVDTGSSLLVIAVFLVGFIAFEREDRWILALLTLPIGLSLIASGLRLYPVGGRLSLFALPALVIVMSAGLIDEWKSGRKTFGAVMVSVLLFFPVLSASNTLLRNPTRDEIRPVLAHISKKWERGDVIFVNSLAKPAFTFYTMFGDGRPPWALGETIFARGHQHSPEYFQEFNVLRGRSRVWVVFSHTYVHPDDERLYVKCLDQIGRRHDEYRAAGASGYLYDFSKTSAGTACFANASLDGVRVQTSERTEVSM